MSQELSPTGISILGREDETELRLFLIVLVLLFVTLAAGCSNLPLNTDGGGQDFHYQKNFGQQASKIG